MEKAIKLLRDIARDPFPFLETLKRQKLFVGITPGDVPHELVVAAGLHPVTIFGTNEPIKFAGALLPDNTCSLAKSCLELALNYRKGFFDGFIVSQLDDTTQHLSDIWERRSKDKFFHKFLPPRQLGRPSAFEWFKKEIKRLTHALEGFTHRRLAGEDIWWAIKAYNRNRRLLSELYEVKREKPGLLGNRLFFDLVKASFYMDKEEHSRLLEEILEGLKGQEAKIRESIPVALAGIVVEPAEIFDLLDEAGFNVVCDNLLSSSRYINSLVPEEGDPFEALTYAHFRKPNFSPIHDSPSKMIEDLIDMVRSYRAKGLIYVHIQYCESQDFDLPDIKRRMRQEGIPLVVLTTEYQTKHLSLMKTRIEAFKESLLEGSYEQ